MSGVEIEFSVTNGNIEDAEEEETETDQTDASQRQRNDAVRGMVTISAQPQ